MFRQLLIIAMFCIFLSDGKSVKKSEPRTVERHHEEKVKHNLNDEITTSRDVLEQIARSVDTG